MNVQKGYVLPFTLVILTMLMVTSASFFSRNADFTSMSSLMRDHDLAVMLAESATNRVIGRYYNDDATLYNIDGCVSNMIGDINCDGLLDNPQSRPSSLNPVLPLNLGYEFFISNNNSSITELSPGILQMIANGEARATGTAQASQLITSTTQYLQISNLFESSTIKPLLFTHGANGLVRSTNTWATEAASSKVAVFIEASRNPKLTNSSWIDIWVCAISQVGTSKAYGMRYIGSFTDTLGGAIPAPISEAATHG